MNQAARQSTPMTPRGVPDDPGTCGRGQFGKNFSEIRGAEESAGEFVGDKATAGLAISGRIAEIDADAGREQHARAADSRTRAHQRTSRRRRCEKHTGEPPAGGATSTVVDADADIDPALAE